MRLPKADVVLADLLRIPPWRVAGSEAIQGVAERPRGGAPAPRE